jgi:hypothetical protein
MVKEELEGVCCTITKDYYVAAFRQWVDHWIQYIEREGAMPKNKF